MELCGYLCETCCNIEEYTQYTQIETIDEIVDDN